MSVQTMKTNFFFAFSSFHNQFIQFSLDKHVLCGEKRQGTIYAYRLGLYTILVMMIVPFAKVSKSHIDWM